MHCIIARSPCSAVSALGDQLPSHPATLPVQQYQPSEISSRPTRPLSLFSSISPRGSAPVPPGRSPCSAVSALGDQLPSHPAALPVQQYQPSEISSRPTRPLSLFSSISPRRSAPVPPGRSPCSAVSALGDQLPSHPPALPVQQYQPSGIGSSRPTRPLSLFSSISPRGSAPVPPGRSPCSAVSALGDQLPSHPAALPVQQYQPSEISSRHTQPKPNASSCLLNTDRHATKIKAAAVHFVRTSTF